MKNVIEAFDKTSKYEPMNKIIKSYALDEETIEFLEESAKDLGLKSRSEVLRYVLKECKKQWQKVKQYNEQN